MIRTVTPPPVASLIAPPTRAAVSGWRLKSYWAMSSVRFAPARKSATTRATSSADWPPSVKVRTVIAESIVASLAQTRIGSTYNQYAAQPRLCERLAAYLGSRAGAPLLLVGEAAG